MHSNIYKNTEAEAFTGDSASVTTIEDKVDTDIVSNLNQTKKHGTLFCDVRAKTISHTIDIITPIKLNDVYFKDYALSRDGDLFVVDNNGNFSLVEVIACQNSSNPTQVQVDKQKRSLSNIYADTFNISKPEASRIIRNKHSSCFQPRTYRLKTQICNE